MPMTDEELERRYRDLLNNPAIKAVVEARTKNSASPVDEHALLDFVRKTEREHAAYVRDVFRKHSSSLL